MNTTTPRPEEMTRRAHRLPAPTPGQAVVIPLELLPIYLAAHRLGVMDLGEISKLEQATGQRKEPGTVWVRRTTGTGA